MHPTAAAAAAAEPDWWASRAIGGRGWSSVRTGDSWRGGGLRGVDDRLNRRGLTPRGGGRPCRPSPLTAVIGAGSLKWVATAECIIFENAFTRALLVTSATLSCSFHVTHHHHRYAAVSNCLPPASEMSCQTWTGRPVCPSWRLQIRSDNVKKQGGGE